MSLDNQKTDKILKEGTKHDDVDKAKSSKKTVVVSILVVLLLAGSLLCLFASESIKKEIELEVVAEDQVNDVTPPEILGPDTFESPLNEGISYKKIVTITDDSGENVSLEVDNTAVDTNTEGDYLVTYTAKDQAGNVSTKEVTITIYKKTQNQELVEDRAQLILQDITNDGMSDEEIAITIYHWVNENVSFTNSNKIRDSWLDGAYAGLFNKSGDCYVYAMTTKLLLDTAGIVNMDIEKIPAESVHFWNLVDVGNGWVHLDTNRRNDDTVICLWDDATLMAYSEANDKSHNYDKTQYPSIN